MSQNTLYQYSVVAGLMAGVASSGLPIEDLLKHGDHGLGTFKGMRGELIIVDGEVWQMKHDGSVRKADIGPNGDVTPFAMLLPFSPTASTTVGSLPSKTALNETLSTLLPQANNIHVAFKLRGTFNLTTRTAEGQCYPGEPLTGVASRQVNVTMNDRKGVVVGFRSPQFLQGVVVAGLHLHFIDDDRTAGGHVMEIEGKNVEIEAAPCWRTVMDLPTGDEFNNADLTVDNEGIQKVEG